MPFEPNIDTPYSNRDDISGNRAGRQERYIKRQVYWDDLRFPATAINPPGLVSDPDFDTTNIGYLFDATATEILFMIAQMPHLYKEGSEIVPHLHWIQNQNKVPAWKMEYRWYNIGDLVPAGFTAIDTTTQVKTYVSGNLQQISSFGIIDGTGKTISSLLDIKISRIGANDTYTGDALLKEFDIHFQIDSPGSIGEMSKGYL